MRATAGGKLAACCSGALCAGGLGLATAGPGFDAIVDADADGELPPVLAGGCGFFVGRMVGRTVGQRLSRAPPRHWAGRRRDRRRRAAPATCARCGRGRTRRSTHPKPSWSMMRSGNRSRISAGRQAATLPHAGQRRDRRVQQRHIAHRQPALLGTPGCTKSGVSSSANAEGIVGAATGIAARPHAQRDQPIAGSSARRRRGSTIASMIRQPGGAAGTKARGSDFCKNDGSAARPGCRAPPPGPAKPA